METLESFSAWARWVLGLDADELDAWRMMLRAVLVYPVAVGMVRLSEKRFIGKFSAFDVILGIMIGSILSRAVTGNSPFLPTLLAGLVLVALHYGFAALAFHSEWFGDIVKGSPRTLVQDGHIQWDAMRRSHISEKDLLSGLRENGRTEDVRQVRLARLERSGNISVILKDDGPPSSGPSRESDGP